MKIQVTRLTQIEIKQSITIEFTSSKSMEVFYQWLANGKADLTQEQMKRQGIKYVNINPHWHKTLLTVSVFFYPTVTKEES